VATACAAAAAAAADVGAEGMYFLHVGYLPFIIRRMDAPRGKTLSSYHNPLTAVAATAANTPQAVLPSRQYETVG